MSHPDDPLTIMIPPPRPDLMVEGRTALIVPVAGLGPRVDTWRQRADPIAEGVPPHITVLVPFLPLADIDDSVTDWLAATFAKFVMPEQIIFDQVRTFPEVVWLHPQDSEPFVELTERVFRRWPECPPYEGRHDEVIPHLTLAHGADLAKLITQDLAGELPLSGQVSGVHLFAFTDGGWRDQYAFPFGRR